MAVSDNVVESVRMYVMNPFSYRRCASDMVCDDENRSLRPASCCSVEVMNGGYGRRVYGLRSTLRTATGRSTSASRSTTLAASSSSTTPSRVI